MKIMDRKFTLQLIGLFVGLIAIYLLIAIAIKRYEPVKSYKIKIREVVYETDTYFMDGEYIVFTDELGRDIEVHKNFVSIEEVK